MFTGYLSTKHIYTHVKIYETMMENVEIGTEKLFQDLNIPLEYVSLAMTALNKHSQNEIFGGSLMNNAKLISETDQGKADQMFEKFHVPVKFNMNVEELNKFLFQK